MGEAVVMPNCDQLSEKVHVLKASSCACQVGPDDTVVELARAGGIFKKMGALRAI